jgi:UDP-glucuronate decarboxylase
MAVPDSSVHTAANACSIPATMSPFPPYIEVDEIYNLACPASPIHYQFDPVQTTKTSVHGAINMLGLAKRVKAKIFQASTSEVYGSPQVHPQAENYWGPCQSNRSSFLL